MACYDSVQNAAITRAVERLLVVGPELDKAKAANAMYAAENYTLRAALEKSKACHR